MALLVIGCGETTSQADSSRAQAASKAASSKQPEKKIAARKGNPLPDIHGTSLEGRPLSLSSQLGKRTLIAFFSPGTDDGDVALKALANIEGLRISNNFQILAIASGASAARTQEVLHRYAPKYPIIFDRSGEIAKSYQLRIPTLFIGMDPDGYLSFVEGMIPPKADNREEILEQQLRKALLLPEKHKALALPELGDYPNAPEFTTTELNGKTPFTLGTLRGRPVILVFFLYNCPHCHHAFNFFKEALPKIPKKNRPVLVGVELSGRTAEAIQRLKQDGLDFFPALLDRDHAIRNAYSSRGGVPDIFFINSAGKIVEHTSGWRDQRDPPLARMRLAKLADIDIPMLLNKNGYSGTEFCTVCHDDETHTWAFTAHSSAFATLIKHGEDHNPECVGCHVVGNDNPGGFILNGSTPEMENVGCESCHGPGGSHLDEDQEATDDYEPTCKGCHDTKHSLGFEYNAFLDKISHKANAKLLALPLAEKQKLLAKRGRIKPPLLPISADFVGSESCRECHQAESDTWSKGPHAHAGKSLDSKGKGGETDCLRCHTTGFDQPGGFPTQATTKSSPALANVGCESCHGPGGNHIGEDAAREGTIISLADKCNSCVILQICGVCHDNANDPGFEFKVKEKIDAIRHGTTGTGE